MSMSRRSVLFGSAAVAVLPLVGCTTMGGINPSVMDFIQKAVAAAAKYIPTIESIAATAAGLFGPTWAAAVQIGTNALNQVISTLTSIVTSLPPASRRALRARLRGSSALAPVIIGQTRTGVTVTGYQVQ